MLKTTDEAREYFKPLTYDDLTEDSFNKLVSILTKHLGNWNSRVLDAIHGGYRGSEYYMTIWPHKKYGKYPGTRFVDKDGIKEAFIIVECDQYSKREGISFNKDGWIGFAGWSDSTNVRPFLDAFEEWVDVMQLEKYGVKPCKFEKIELNLPEGYQERYHDAVIKLIEKGIPMEQSLFDTDITIYKKDLDYWTPEQYDKIKEIKNIEQTQGIKIASALNKEQRETFISSYFVDEFPENPEMGRMVCKDGVEYVYTGDWKSMFKVPETPQEKLEAIMLYLDKQPDTPLKEQIFSIIGE